MKLLPFRRRHLNVRSPTPHMNAAVLRGAIPGECLNCILISLTNPRLRHQDIKGACLVRYLCFIVMWLDSQSIMHGNDDGGDGNINSHIKSVPNLVIVNELTTAGQCPSMSRVLMPLGMPDENKQLMNKHGVWMPYQSASHNVRPTLAAALCGVRLETHPKIKSR